MNLGDFDVAVIGAGPVGSVAALAHARQGARVALLEANPDSSRRLAGEWLHPRALDVLDGFDISLDGGATEASPGHGFVVFPDYDDDAIVLPYADNKRGLSCAHSTIVDTLRNHAIGHSQISYFPQTRVVSAADHTLTATSPSTRQKTLRADRIVGAYGRNGVAASALGLHTETTACSYTIGVILEQVELPYDGFGHVFPGGVGPAVAYRLGPGRVRLILDVPLFRPRGCGLLSWLWGAYAYVLPDSIRSAFRKTLEKKETRAACNKIRLRRNYGHNHIFLVGDSVGHCHPLTAIGMTMGFLDALRTADSRNVSEYRGLRIRESLAAELLAVGLYEIFADQSDEAVVIRHAMFDRWRQDPRYRMQSMQYLSCQDTNLRSFGRDFGSTTLSAMAKLMHRSPRHLPHALRVIRSIGARLGWLGIGLSRLNAESLPHETSIREGRARGALTRALPASIPSRPPSDPSLTSVGSAASASFDWARALQRGTAALIRQQRTDGGWEGEVVWCPMLAAQYVLMCMITRTTVSDERRSRLLTHFRHTQLPSGLWGLHEHSQPYLFVTTLVYVAARVLGVDRSDPLLSRAAEFITQEGGVIAIPSWGKFWLAMLNLYDWNGVNPLLPEVWLLPRSIPLHPTHFYCHTRLIYMGLAVIYGEKFQIPVTPVIEELRSELFPTGYDRVNFSKARNRLRRRDLCAPPGPVLKFIHRLSWVVERWHQPALRRRILARLRERIRWDLNTSDHTNLSPVSGLLNMIALWIADPRDEDFVSALTQFEGWIWEDDAFGTRVAGARSGSWDTAFALQALGLADSSAEQQTAIERGTSLLWTQQIQQTFAGYQDNDRIDPKGGWCFAGIWHGWPVSDCTAEALLALAGHKSIRLKSEALLDAVTFILRCQNADGGFGSYESSRIRYRLDWLNPAEMFADCMTDRSWIECTASCIEVLAKVRERLPPRHSAAVGSALAKAKEWLARQQLPDGSWRGAWGVHFIYGTFFGIRGLIAAGVPYHHPMIRKACRWLLSRQRSDGGWGEHFSGCLSGHYIEHRESQVIQTAWAVMALLEARDPDWGAIDRGIAFLVATQQEDGQWPKQQMPGIFFRSALLDYTLYRVYFPVMALGLYQTHRAQRLDHDAQGKAIESAETTGNRMENQPSRSFLRG